MRSYDTMCKKIRRLLILLLTLLRKYYKCRNLNIHCTTNVLIQRPTVMIGHDLRKSGDNVGNCVDHDTVSSAHQQHTTFLDRQNINTVDRHWVASYMGSVSRVPRLGQSHYFSGKS